MTVVNHRQIGQLGNQLFHNAHFSASAIEHKFFYIDPVFGYPLDWFPSINSHPNISFREASGLECKLRIRLLRILQFFLKQSSFHCFYNSTQVNCIFDLSNENFIKDATEKLVFCEGFSFRDYFALKKHSKTIKTIFSPNQDIYDDVNITYNRINPGSQYILLGLHIRRADYREYMDGKYYYSNKEWIELIERILIVFQKFNNLKIIIFSDENVSEISKDFKKVFCVTGTTMHDLNLMAKMDYLLGPPSTFSGWASFLGDVPILHLESISQSIEIENFVPIMA